MTHSQETHLFLVPKHVGWKDLGDVVVVVHLRGGSSYVFRESSREIWRCIAEGGGEAECVKRLCSAFDVSEHEASIDVASFISKLLEEGVVAHAG